MRHYHILEAVGGMYAYWQLRKRFGVGSRDVPYIAAFRAAATTARWRVIGPKKAFVIEGEDRVGALVDYFAKLAEAKINVTATDAVDAGAGRFGAIMWVKPRDVKRAARGLGVG